MFHLAWGVRLNTQLFLYSLYWVLKYMSTCFSFPFSSHVSESVNNSIFHQIAEQLQQQNLDHLRQQLLEQQQPQKVCNSILWPLELLLSAFYKLVFKCGDFPSAITRTITIFRILTIFSVIKMYSSNF